MPLFEVPKRAGKEIDNSIAKKAKSTISSSKVIKGGLIGKIKQIQETVDNYLGKYKDEYEIINTVDALQNYIESANEKGVIAIDTETTGLDPIQDKIVGFSIYTPTMKGAYIPINHVSYVTNERVDNQLTEAEVRQVLNNLHAKIIMFNAKFDIRVIKNQIGVKLQCYWDCYLASRLMNENEQNKGLKALHQKYVLDDKEDEFKFDALFRGISFDKIPINTGYLYAAHDAVITYELYEFQKQYLYYDMAEDRTSRNGMNGVAWVFHNIEMPCVDAVVEMEDNGIELDLGVTNQLSIKYNALLVEKEKEFYKALEPYEDLINAYRRKHINIRIDDPINIASSTQLSILLYDILQMKASTRGTGSDILKALNNPICDAILEYRGIAKLINTYIDKMPSVLSRDGRIHCSFNQYGADTGRFSSSDPNLQNIPSRNKEIRTMFKAKDGNVLMSSDYSQQEPKCLAALCKKQGDSQMYDTFMEGKDLYSEIASKAFNRPYEECKEFNADGSTNKEGKERRTHAKSILLGVLYGMSVASIAENLKISTEKAQSIKDSVFKGFPAIEQFEKDSLLMGEELGYVTTVCGRKRRLPDLQLSTYDFKWNGNKPMGDVLDFDESGEVEVPDDRIDFYLNKLNRCKPWDKRKIFEQANEEGIWIIDNGKKIADAERQCVNARIQGSASDLTKLALIELVNNERLRELGFKLLIPIHDEILAECPEENVRECSKLLADTMSKAAEKILEMPIKCDVALTKNWYGVEYEY